MSLTPTTKDLDRLKAITNDAVTALAVSRIMIYAAGIALLCHTAGPSFFQVFMCFVLWSFGTGAALKLAEMVHASIGRRAILREGLRQIASKPGPE